MADEQYDYIGISKCGCVSAIVYDDGSQFAAEDVASFIESGLTVERVVVAEACRRLRAGMKCTHGIAEP